MRTSEIRGLCFVGDVVSTRKVYQVEFTCPSAHDISITRGPYHLSRKSLSVTLTGLLL